MAAMAWLRDNRYWLLACAVLAAGGYGAGRYSAPTRTEVVLQTVTEFRDVEKKVVEKGPVRYKKVIVETPGKDTVTTVTVDRDPVTITVDREVEKKVLETKTEIVERDAPRLTLGATVGWDGAPTYGGFLGYRVLGPLTLIGQGEGGANGWSARVGAGISF